MSSGNQASVDVPVPTRIVTAVAARNLIDEGDLWDALEAIHRNVVDGADAVVDHYESGDGPEAVDVADGLATVLFVDAETWDQSAQAVPQEVRAAAKAAHAEFAGELDVEEATLDAYDPLVVPSRAVGELVRAGLSQRQAEVQVLREAGYTQREVGERLGMATNTVKVHCHRIDAKVDDAKRLIELVEE
jgi:DNA-binding CsgD family transcriptional regulator